MDHAVLPATCTLCLLTKNSSFAVIICVTSSGKCVTSVRALSLVGRLHPLSVRLVADVSLTVTILLDVKPTKQIFCYYVVTVFHSSYLMYTSGASIYLP
jgi:hypothetical protein